MLSLRNICDTVLSEGNLHQVRLMQKFVAWYNYDPDLPIIAPRQASKFFRLPSLYPKRLSAGADTNPGSDNEETNPGSDNEDANPGSDNEENAMVPFSGEDKPNDSSRTAVKYLKPMSLLTKQLAPLARFVQEHYTKELSDCAELLNKAFFELKDVLEKTLLHAGEQSSSKLKLMKFCSTFCKDIQGNIKRNITIRRCYLDNSLGKLNDGQYAHPDKIDKSTLFNEIRDEYKKLTETEQKMSCPDPITTKPTQNLFKTFCEEQHHNFQQQFETDPFAKALFDAALAWQERSNTKTEKLSQTFVMFTALACVLTLGENLPLMRAIDEGFITGRPSVVPKLRINIRSQKQLLLMDEANPQKTTTDNQLLALSDREPQLKQLTGGETTPDTEKVRSFMLKMEYNLTDFLHSSCLKAYPLRIYYQKQSENPKGWYEFDIKQDNFEENAIKKLKINNFDYFDPDTGIRVVCTYDKTNENFNIQWMGDNYEKPQNISYRNIQYNNCEVIDVDNNCIYIKLFNRGNKQKVVLKVDHKKLKVDHKKINFEVLNTYELKTDYSLKVFSIDTNKNNANTNNDTNIVYVVVYISEEQILSSYVLNKNVVSTVIDTPVAMKLFDDVTLFQKNNSACLYVLDDILYAGTINGEIKSVEMANDDTFTKTTNIGEVPSKKAIQIITKSRHSDLYIVDNDKDKIYVMRPESGLLMHVIKKDRTSNFRELIKEMLITEDQQFLVVKFDKCLKIYNIKFAHKPLIRTISFEGNIHNLRTRKQYLKNENCEQYFTCSNCHRQYWSDKIIPYWKRPKRENVTEKDCKVCFMCNPPNPLLNEESKTFKHVNGLYRIVPGEKTVVYRQMSFTNPHTILRNDANRQWVLQNYKREPIAETNSSSDDSLFSSLLHWKAKDSRAKLYVDMDTKSFIYKKMLFTREEDNTDKETLSVYKCPEAFTTEKYIKDRLFDPHDDDKKGTFIKNDIWKDLKENLLNFSLNQNSLNHEYFSRISQSVHDDGNDLIEKISRNNKTNTPTPNTGNLLHTQALELIQDQRFLMAKQIEEYYGPSVANIELEKYARDKVLKLIANDTNNNNKFTIVRGELERIGEAYLVNDDNGKNFLDFSNDMVPIPEFMYNRIDFKKKPEPINSTNNNYNYLLFLQDPDDKFIGTPCIPVKIDDQDGGSYKTSTKFLKNYYNQEYFEEQYCLHYTNIIEKKFPTIKSRKGHDEQNRFYNEKLQYKKIVEVYQNLERAYNEEQNKLNDCFNTLCENIKKEIAKWNSDKDNLTAYRENKLYLLLNEKHDVFQNIRAYDDNSSPLDQFEKVTGKIQTHNNNIVITIKMVDKNTYKINKNFTDWNDLEMYCKNDVFLNLILLKCLIKRKISLDFNEIYSKRIEHIQSIKKDINQFLRSKNIFEMTDTQYINIKESKELESIVKDDNILNFFNNLSIVKKQFSRKKGHQQLLCNGNTLLVIPVKDFAEPILVFRDFMKYTFENEKIKANFQANEKKYEEDTNHFPEKIAFYEKNYWINAIDYLTQQYFIQFHKYYYWDSFYLKNSIVSKYNKLLHKNSIKGFVYDIWKKSEHGEKFFNWYKGEITKVNDKDGTYNVKFDSKSAKKKSSKLSLGASVKLSLGASVKTKDNLYKGKITKVSSDGTYVVKFDDGVRGSTSPKQKSSKHGKQLPVKTRVKAPPSSPAINTTQPKNFITKLQNFIKKITAATKNQNTIRNQLQLSNKILNLTLPKEEREDSNEKPEVNNHILLYGDHSNNNFILKSYSFVNIKVKEKNTTKNYIYYEYEMPAGFKAADENIFSNNNKFFQFVRNWFPIQEKYQWFYNDTINALAAIPKYDKYYVYYYVNHVEYTFKIKIRELTKEQISIIPNHIQMKIRKNEIINDSKLQEFINEYGDQYLKDNNFKYKEMDFFGNIHYQKGEYLEFDDSVTKVTYFARYFDVKTLSENIIKGNNTTMKQKLINQMQQLENDVYVNVNEEQDEITLGFRKMAEATGKYTMQYSFKHIGETVKTEYTIQRFLKPNLPTTQTAVQFFKNSKMRNRISNNFLKLYIKHLLQLFRHHLLLTNTTNEHFNLYQQLLFIYRNISFGIVRLLRSGLDKSPFNTCGNTIPLTNVITFNGNDDEAKIDFDELKTFIACFKVEFFENIPSPFVKEGITGNGEEIVFLTTEIKNNNQRDKSLNINNTEHKTNYLKLLQEQIELLRPPGGGDTVENIKELLRKAIIDVQEKTTTT